MKTLLKNGTIYDGTGTAHVFVNGEPVMQNGAYRSARAGEVVLKR